MKTTFPHLLLLTALSLPGLALAQPGERPDDRGERDRSERDDRNRNRDRDRDDERRKQREPIPVELVEPAMAAIRELHPDAPWLGRVEQLIKEDPDEAAKHLGRFPGILELIDARENRPEEFALHVRNTALMREIFAMVREARGAKRDGDQAKVDALRPQIREKTEEIFDLRIQIEQMKIQRMKAELAQAEEELAEVIAGKEEEIDKRMHDMLDREWDRRRRGGDDDDEGDRRRERDRDKPEKDADEER